MDDIMALKTKSNSFYISATEIICIIIGIIFVFNIYYGELGWACWHSVASYIHDNEVKSLYLCTWQTPVCEVTNNAVNIKATNNQLTRRNTSRVEMVQAWREVKKDTVQQRCNEIQCCTVKLGLLSDEMCLLKSVLFH